MMNQSTPVRIGSRFRGLVIIWAAQLLALIAPFVVLYFVKPLAQVEPNQSLLLVFAALALTAFSLSFVLKSQFISRAVAQQRPDLVTSGYVLAFVLCEACALLGLAAHFATGARESIYFLAPAVFGLLLHFPRRRHIDDASGGHDQSFTTTTL